jgi:hypothetical protein
MADGDESLGIGRMRGGAGLLVHRRWIEGLLPCLSGGQQLIRNRAPTLTGRRAPSEPWIHGLRLERQHGEDALVHAPERLTPDEPVEPLEAEGELTEG